MRAKLHFGKKPLSTYCMRSSISTYIYNDLLQVAKLFSFTWTMGNFLCKAVHYMQSVSAICSVFILTAVSIER